MISPCSAIGKQRGYRESVKGAGCLANGVRRPPERFGVSVYVRPLMQIQLSVPLSRLSLLVKDSLLDPMVRESPCPKDLLSRFTALVGLSILPKLLSMIHAEVWMVGVWSLQATVCDGLLDTWCLIKFVIVGKTFLKCIWINQDFPAHTAVLCR